MSGTAGAWLSQTMRLPSVCYSSYHIYLPLYPIQIKQPTSYSHYIICFNRKEDITLSANWKLVLSIPPTLCVDQLLEIRHHHHHHSDWMFSFPPFFLSKNKLNGNSNACSNILFLARNLQSCVNKVLDDCFWGRISHNLPKFSRLVSSDLSVWLELLKSK